MNRVIPEVLDHPQGQVPDRYDVNEVMKETWSSIDPQIRAQFTQLLRTFSGVFSKSKWDIGKCDLVQHNIDFYSGSKRVKLPNCRMPMHFKNGLRQQIDKFLEHKVITPFHSPHSSPAMMAPKKTGKLRLVIDYRQLNKQTVKYCWPLLSVEESFETLEGSCYYFTLDMSWGFHQLRQNNNHQVDDEQSGITHGHDAGATEPTSHFTVIEQQGELLDIPHSIAHCNSADLELRAGLSKQIKEKFPSYFLTKTDYKQQLLHAQYLGHDKFVYHLIVKPRDFHGPTNRSLLKALLAFRDQMNFYRINKLGFPHLSCGFNKLDRIEVQKLIHETFHDSNLELTVSTLKTPLQSTTYVDQKTAADSHKSQKTDTRVKQVLTWVRKHSRPPRSHLQSLPCNV